MEACNCIIAIYAYSSVYKGFFFVLLNDSIGREKYFLCLHANEFPDNIKRCKTFSRNLELYNGQHYLCPIASFFSETFVDKQNMFNVLSMLC